MTADFDEMARALVPSPTLNCDYGDAQTARVLKSVDDLRATIALALRTVYASAIADAAGVADERARRFADMHAKLSRARKEYGSEGASTQDIASASGQQFSAAELAACIRALTGKGGQVASERGKELMNAYGKALKGFWVDRHDYALLEAAHTKLALHLKQMDELVVAARAHNESCEGCNICDALSALARATDGEGT